MIFTHVSWHLSSLRIERIPCLAFNQITVTVFRVLIILSQYGTQDMSTVLLERDLWVALRLRREERKSEKIGASSLLF